MLFDAAIDLIASNHMRANDLHGKDLRDVIPAIIWERPVPAAA
ncbi:uncharacterized protein YvpB [Rhizobium halophytocola]|uniref:Uncharacterized protein YvpB n=1 Tax=Rhizobium halophytocola TaxID=735519 RepID=A0ABS4DXN1_9HYPH|nr:uncharacterized protein YvpB [Rhizobium halophytocola]